MKYTGKLFVVSAPSGAGKTSLVNALCRHQELAVPLERVVTYTTKTPRPGELNGIDYHFISEEEFKVRIEKGFFIEWSTAYGNYYGSPASILEEVNAGKSLFLILDRTGARAVQRVYTQAVLIWVYTKDLEILKKRLFLRNTEKESEIFSRLALAKQEILQENEKNFFSYQILNENFETALSELEMIVEKELNFPLKKR